MPKGLESLFIEINALIYQEKAKHFTKLGLSAAENHELQQRTFAGVWSEIERLTKLVNPTQELFLSVDGVAPLAKIMQQRKRRYLSTVETKTSDFDSTKISPGTDFMFEFDEFMRGKLASTALAPKVTYSSHLEQGEGEHKIANYLRQSTLRSAVIHGLDADLFMINLPIVQNFRKNVILYRESSDDRGEILQVVSLETMNRILQDIFKSPAAAEEFTLLMFLIGNDFLPRFTVFEKTDDALQTLLGGYQEYRQYGPSIIQGSQPVWANLSQFLTFLEQRGYYQLLLESWANDRRIKVPSLLAKSNLKGGKFDTVTFDSQYYHYIFRPRGRQEIGFRADPRDIEDLKQQYLNGIDWAFGYYRDGGSSTGYHYFYPYFYPPLIGDFARFLVNGRVQYDRLASFPSPLEQLLMIIPIQSKGIVPKRIQIVYDSVKSPVYDLMPSKFLVDKEGKLRDHDQIALIPFPNYTRIQDVVNLLKLDETEKAKYRNVPAESWTHRMTPVQPVTNLPTVPRATTLPSLLLGRREGPRPVQPVVHGQPSRPVQSVIQTPRSGPRPVQPVVHGQPSRPVQPVIQTPRSGPRQPQPIRPVQPMMQSGSRSALPPVPVYSQRPASPVYKSTSPIYSQRPASPVYVPLPVLDLPEPSRKTVPPPRFTQAVKILPVDIDLPDLD